MRISRISAVFLLLGIAILSAAAVAVSFMPSDPLIVTVKPAGEQTVFLEWGQPYEEAGASATATRKGSEPVSVAVTTEGTVDETKLGSYTICYTAEYKGRRGKACRQVQVVDTKPPEITLVSDPEHFTIPNQTYQEEGFTATDDYDGDITSAVVRTETREAVTYTVRDSSGNETAVTRPIVYHDPTPPELTLQGEAVVVMNVGDTYCEPGYTATDDCEGDITGKVTVSGAVDRWHFGSYTLTYTVSDAYGNTDSATRQVIVKAPEVTKVNDPTKTDKVIYLTFDDGPGKDTPRLLDILAKYNVKATFFVVNTAYISTVQRAAEEGHTVAIHTMTHRFKEIYASEEAFFQDLYGMQAIIESHTGQKPMLMRFPGGSSNTISKFNPGVMTRLTQKVTEEGFRYFDWNVDSKDAGGATTAQEVFEIVTYCVSSKTESVVLMHDIKDYTVDAVEPIIVWALENGYTFLPLTEESPTCHHPIHN